MTYDLNNLDTSAVADDGAVLDVRHPVTGEAVGITITLAGADSAKYRTARDSMLRKNLRRRNPDPAAMMEDDAKLLAACTLGWAGVVVKDETVTFSEKAAFDLYMRYPWLREQVAQFIGDRANFLPGGWVN